jgi:hypothetical protein
MSLSVGISAYLNKFSKPMAADIGLHGLMKRQHGKLIPFYRLRLGGDCAASNAGLTLMGPEIPAARVDAAIARIQHTYRFDHVEGEQFADWVCRNELPFFTELLDDFIQVSPSDLPELLNKTRVKREFVALDEETQTVEGDAQVNALLAESFREQAGRDAALLDGDMEHARACSENILDLAAKAVIHARGEVLIIDGELAAPLQRALPYQPELVAVYVVTRTAIAQAETMETLMNLSDAVDDWLQNVTVNCYEKVLEQGLLNLEDDVLLQDFSAEPAPLAFLKVKSILSSQPENAELQFKLVDGKAADYIARGLQSIGFEASVQSAKEGDQKTLLTVKASAAGQTPTLQSEDVAEQVAVH